MESFIFRDDRIEHDYGNRSLKVNGTAVHLAPIGHGILYDLTTTPGRLVPYKAFRSPKYGHHADKLSLRELVKVNVSRLRVKLDGALKSEESCIEVVRGAGYRYIPHGEWRKIPLRQPSSG